MPEIFSLRPGWQEFPKGVFEAHLEDPEVQQLIKDKHIVISDVVIQEKQGKKTVKVELGKADVEVHLVAIKEEKKCLEIIAGTFNRELLQRWIDEENRSKIKRALEKRMKDVFDPKTE